MNRTSRRKDFENCVEQEFLKETVSADIDMAKEIYNLAVYR